MATETELKPPPQLVHTTRQMFEARIERYDDPQNLDWDWSEVRDKWERHAFSAFMDLQSVEAEVEKLRAERDNLLKVLETRAARELEMLEGVARENDALREALEKSANAFHNCHKGYGRDFMHKVAIQYCQWPECLAARAVLAPEGKE